MKYIGYRTAGRQVAILRPQPAPYLWGFEYILADFSKDPNCTHSVFNSPLKQSAILAASKGRTLFMCDTEEEFLNHFFPATTEFLVNADFAELEQRVITQHIITENDRKRKEEYNKPIDLDNRSLKISVSSTKTGRFLMNQSAPSAVPSSVSITTFETKHYFNGSEIKYLSNDQFIKQVADIESRLNYLSNLTSKSKKIDKQIKNLREGLAKAIKIFDNL
jgi:hypothetical protein